LHHLSCGWHVVRRDPTCADDGQHANAASRNDASRTPGYTARNASEATSNTLERAKVRQRKRVGVTPGEWART